MKQFNIGLSIAIAAMILLQLVWRSKLIVKAKNTAIEKTSLTLSLGMVIVVTLVGSSDPFHYLIGTLLGILLVASLAKTGISPRGFHSMSRIFFSLPWQQVRLIKVVKMTNGTDFEIHSVGRIWTNVMTFEMSDYDRTMGILKQKLSADKIEITIEKLEPGLRDQTKGRRGK